MSELFAELLAQSLVEKDLAPGTIVRGKVVHIGNDHVVVNAGLKSEGVIPVNQFLDENGHLEIEVGDEVDVALDKLEDGFGETILSRDKAKRAESWIRLIAASEANQTIKGTIVARVKGGFTVEIDEVKAFLPGSLIDVRPLRDTSHLEGRPLDFKVIKVDQKRNNIVVSRRAVIEEESGADRQTLLQNMAEGQEMKGVVKNLTDYGAFIDLGGVDGLLHITDMSWKRIKHPSEILAIGDEIEVKVLKYDAEKNRVSLGMKQLGADPWFDLKERFKPNMRLQGKVSSVADYGCFVELEGGVEGLVHMSEMDWTNKNVNPHKVVSVGQEVEVMVLEVDEDRRRFSLGLKQCTANPWDAFAKQYGIGDKVKGPIKSITDFGVFIGLAGSIDGLIHLSDLSWDKAGEEVVRDYQKGQEVEAVILSIDPEKERISLGIKQLTANHFATYLDQHPKGTIVSGTVTAVDEKEATVELAAGVTGVIKAADAAQEKVADVREVLHVGDKVEARVMMLDKKTNKVGLSIRAKEQYDQRTALDELKQTNSPNATLGDLLKKEMDKH